MLVCRGRVIRSVDDQIISAFDSITDLGNKLLIDIENSSDTLTSTETDEAFDQSEPSASAGKPRMGKLPTSLSILMNFDQYGTSSVRFLRYFLID